MWFWIGEDCVSIHVQYNWSSRSGSMGTSFPTHLDPSLSYHYSWLKSDAGESPYVWCVLMYTYIQVPVDTCVHV